jgi:hypothetical protein
MKTGGEIEYNLQNQEDWKEEIWMLQHLEI